MRRWLVMCGVCWLVGCGGDPAPGDPLIASTLTGEFAGASWTPRFGFARASGPNLDLTVSASEIACADIMNLELRNGRSVDAEVKGLVTGTYPSSFFTFDTLDGTHAHSVGSNEGTVTITAIDDAQVSAMLSYDATISGQHYALAGDVTLVRCLPL